MLATLEPDGTITPNPTGAITSWLPDGSGMRVVMRFIQAAEGIPTYNGLLTVWATYTAVLGAYPDYNAIQTDSALAVNFDVDVACLVTGLGIRNGRTGLFTEIQAASCNISLYDPNGLFDPRSKNTALGPGRRVRAGTLVSVLVYPRTGTAWVPMFTGLVDTWTRNIDPENPSDTRVDCSDAFTGIGSAAFSAVTTAQLTSARVNLYLQDSWQSSWGITSIATGTVTLDARTFDNEQTLDLIKAAAAVEDGRAFVAPDGTFTFQTGTWRDARSPKVTFIGLGAADFEVGTVPCTYARIAAFQPNYATVPLNFLTYNDLMTCNASATVGAVPLVCASGMRSADSGDDVVNDVTLEYNAPQTPTGYVAGNNAKVVATGPTLYNARDTVSITRYGIRSLRRSDLQPNTASTTLPTLANRWVQRWKDGDATITEVDVDLVAVLGNAARILTPMFSGDVANVVDLVPGAEHETDYTVSTAEVASAEWTLNPERFSVTFALDEIRAVTP